MKKVLTNSAIIIACVIACITCFKTLANRPAAMEIPEAETTLATTVETTVETTASETEAPTEIPTEAPTNVEANDVVEETVYATTDVNVRIGPGTEFDRAGVLTPGQTVTRIGFVDDWSEVIYNGEVCYVKSSYLTTEFVAVEEPVEETTHTHKYEDSVSDPTCTDKGYTMHTCACGKSYKDGEKKALGHDYKSVVTAPTVNSVGYTTHICTRCNDEYVDTYTTFETEPEETEPEETEPEEPTNHKGNKHSHTYLVVETIKSNCTTEGYSVYRCPCGDEYIDDYTAMTDHEYKSTVVAPTYEDEGYTQHVCVGCGKTFRDSYVDRLVAETTTPPAVEEDPTENPNEEATEEPTEPVLSECGECHCESDHDHEVVEIGCYTIIYCSHIYEPFKSADGFTAYYPYSYY